MAFVLQTRSRGWPPKGLGMERLENQEGALFEALDEGAPALKSDELILPILNFKAPLYHLKSDILPG